MDYSGMTVNERLYRSGLYIPFDDAVERKDLARVAEILRSVDVDEASIALTLKQLSLKEENR
jgi:hypothetical protein